MGAISKVLGIAMEAFIATMNNYTLTDLIANKQPHRTNE
jgi:hypothetical protein